MVHGNSFANSRSEVAVGRVPVFGGDVRFYPAGAYVAVDSTNTVGTEYPAGTPVSIDTVGGAVTFNAETPTGLLYQDVVIGDNGATVDIVVAGEFYASLSKATITEAQESVLKGLGIRFIKEG
jgi:hypothetical protein